MEKVFDGDRKGPAQGAHRSQSVRRPKNMSAKYPVALSPIRIGNVVLKNHCLRPSTMHSMCPAGELYPPPRTPWPSFEERARARHGHRGRGQGGQGREETTAPMTAWGSERPQPPQQADGAGGAHPTSMGQGLHGAHRHLPRGATPSPTAAASGGWGEAMRSPASHGGIQKRLGGGGPDSGGVRL